MTTRAKQWALFVLISVSALAIAGHAQSFASASAAVPSSFTNETLVVDVNVVNVFFNVRQGNRMLRDLNPQEFEVYEDKRPQAIRFFSAESQQPLTLAILLDSSSSQTNVLNKQLEVGKRFLQQVLRPEDEAMVLGFDSRLQVHQDFTHSPDNLVAALARGLQGTTGETDSFEQGAPGEGRSTALYDAIVATSKHRMQTREGHKAILILTDGQDMGSRFTSEQAIEAAERSDSICYVLLIGDKDQMAAVEYRGVQKMKELTQATGGRMILVKNDRRALERSFNEISDELRHFYSLAYTSDRKQREGEYRKISVKSKHRYSVLARKGYYAVQKKNTILEASR